MERLNKISTYGLILYLALMMCCVQSVYLHHAMHQMDSHQEHGSQVKNNTTPSKLVASYHSQSESTLFKSIFSLELLSGIIFVLLVTFSNLIFPLNTLIAYLKRNKYKRRWRNLLLTSSFGLRSPPAYQ